MSKRKLVLEEHEKNVLVGIMAEGCDPVIRTVEGSLDEALAYIPKFLGEAQEEWAVSQKRPAYVPPKPVKPAVTPVATTPAQKAEDLPLLFGTGKAPEAQVEVTEPPAEKAEQEISERILAPPAPAAAEPAPSAAAKPGEWEYYLQDGRGPFESVQAAMDELGLDKNTRPMHNRWDRLSTALKEKIQRRPKA